MPRSRRLTATLTVCLAALACGAGVATAAPADLDPSFNADGVTHDFLSSLRSAFVGDPVADQAPDGSLVAAAPVSACLFNEQLRGGTVSCSLSRDAETGERGSVDASFVKVVRTDAAGTVIDSRELGARQDARLLDLRVLGSGAGTSTLVYGDGDVVRVHRLNAALDAAPVAARGIGDACPAPDQRASGGALADAEVRADGTIVVAWNCNEGLVVEALQLNEAGDTLSSVAGFDDAPITEPSCSAQNLELSPADVIHVLCTEGEDWWVLRIRGTGGLDPSYGTGGAAEGQLGFVPNRAAMAIGPDGSAIIATAELTPVRGEEEGEWRLVRVAPNGVQDLEFGSGGYAIVSSPLIAFQPEDLTIQSDGRILAIGLERLQDRGPTANRQDGLVIVRFLADGELDPSWDGDSLVLLEVADRFLQRPGAITQQADGKLVLPSIIPSQSAVRDAVTPNPGEDPEMFLALFRFQGDPQPGTTTTTTTTTTTGQQVAAQQQAVVPKTCTSRRKLRIRLRTGRPKGEKSPIVAARVLVNGERVKVTRGSRLRARINLTNLPKGRFAVKIRLRLADGGIVRETRRYRTCTKKIRRQLKPLRTRAPKSARG